MMFLASEPGSVGLAESLILLFVTELKKVFEIVGSKHNVLKVQLKRLNFPNILVSDAKQPIQILEYLQECFVDKTHAEDVTVPSPPPPSPPQHWMMQYPVQCVLVTEEIMWQRNVHHSLAKCDRVLMKSYQYVFALS